MSQSIDGIMLGVFLPFPLSLLSPHTALSLISLPSLILVLALAHVEVYQGYADEET